MGLERESGTILFRENSRSEPAPLSVSFLIIAIWAKWFIWAIRPKEEFNLCLDVLHHVKQTFLQVGWRREEAFYWMTDYAGLHMCRIHAESEL